MSKKLSSGKKQLFAFSVVSGIILATFLIVGGVTNTVSLLRPRWNVPVLVLANETITIEAATDFPLAQANDLAARLKSPFGNFPLTIQSITQDGMNIRATATFPGSIIPNILYDLEITVGGLSDVQRHAVKILSEYKDEFFVIHISDTQVGYSEEYEDIWEDSYEFVEEMVNHVNMINPEFLLLSGDITETALRTEYQFMYDQLMRLNVPVFAGTGNHDYYNTAEYQRWCQYFNFTFDYGPDYHFIYIDTGMNLDALRDQYFSWLADDLDAHSETPVNIISGHAGPYQCNGDDVTRINKNFEYLNAEFVQLCAQYNVTTYLHGHDHKDQIKYAENCSLVPTEPTTSGLRMTQVASVREDAAYRLLHFKDHMLYNITAINNTAPPMGREQKNSIRCFVDNPTTNQPDLSKPNLKIWTNVSCINSLDASPVTGVACNITSKFPALWCEDFSNMTACFSIISSSIPTQVGNFVINDTTQFVSFTPTRRDDLTNTWWVEVKFNLAHGTGIHFEVWGA